MNNTEWFRQAKFGMMIHWGLYSLLAGEYRGQRWDTPNGENIGEWIMSKYQIPISEYEKLASAFNPIYFDADEWVSLAKQAGMKYIVMTSKHHDGFAMFDSSADEYNVCKATPFGRDVVLELSEACKKQGIKFGLYYSQEFDWHEEHGGGYKQVGVDKAKGGITWSNTWDFPNNDKKDYSIYFKNKVLPQVREILTKYGDLCLIWFDTPNVISPEQSKELYDLVKSIQPNCLVNSRIGNGLGDYTSCGDNIIPDDYKETLYEAPCTLNDTWGYMAFDNNWKDAERLIEIKNHLNERGINYLLNVGPDYLGRIPVPSMQLLKKMGQEK